MSALVIAGDTSGTITIEAPAVAGTNTLTLPASTGTVITTGDSATVTQGMIGSGVAGIGPAFAAWQSVTQTGIPNSTWTKVTFTTERFDTNNNFASSRFTPTVAGYYQINTRLTSATTNTSYILIAGIFVNGNIYLQGIAQAGNANYYPTSDVSGLVYLNGTTDYVEIYSFGIQAGTYSLFANSVNTAFDGFLARAA